MSSYPSRAICIDQHGPIEQMKLVNVTVGEPGVTMRQISGKAYRLTKIINLFQIAPFCRRKKWARNIYISL